MESGQRERTNKYTPKQKKWKMPDAWNMPDEATRLGIVRTFTEEQLRLMEARGLCSIAPAGWDREMSLARSRQGPKRLNFYPDWDEHSGFDRIFPHGYRFLDEEGAVIVDPEASATPAQFFRGAETHKAALEDRVPTPVELSDSEHASAAGVRLADAQSSPASSGGVFPQGGPGPKSAATAAIGRPSDGESAAPKRKRIDPDARSEASSSTTTGWSMVSMGSKRGEGRDFRSKRGA